MCRFTDAGINVNININTSLNIPEVALKEYVQCIQRPCVFYVFYRDHHCVLYCIQTNRDCIDHE